MSLLKSLAISLLLINTIHAKTIDTILPHSSTLQWNKVSNMPSGAKVAILMGNPNKREPFIAWVKLPADYTVPVHSHPVNEYDTVISGTYYLGTGNKIDTTQTTALPSGSFATIPAHVLHYGITKEETILQINGVGPWGMIYPQAG